MVMETTRRRFISTLGMGLGGSALGGCSMEGGSPRLSSDQANGPSEFRAAWAASVYNLDWPSRPGLSPAAAKSELITLIERMRSLNLNTMILQIRPNGDALYRSSIEPSSAWLTGSMGSGLSWDPLEVAVTECHRRGMELHAWFNPFRALAGTKYASSSKHLSRKHPEWVRKMGSHIWFDPAERGVQDHALRVIVDVVKRYGIDGVHLDDYFYPYPKKSGGRRLEEFPDFDAFRRSGASNRDAWRRSNVNRFVKDLYSRVHSARKSVKVGISPFGIWKPGIPAGTTAGLDAYNDLAADAVLWLKNGWVDYMTPQLYWGDAGEQSFSRLLKWWQSVNPRGRHIWPGIDVTRERGHSSTEISRQVRYTRTMRGAPAPGQVYWRSGQLVANRGGVASMLTKSLYSEPARVPICPWLT